MKLFLSSARIALATIVSLSAASLTLSAAVAMPVGHSESGTSASTMLQRTAADQHRVYPNSDSAEAKKARAARISPNLYCDKHENECE